MTSLRFTSATPIPEKPVLGFVRQRFPLSPRERWEGNLTYLDTFDWRLYRNNLMLRAETSAGQNLLHLSSLEGETIHSAVVEKVPDFSGELVEGPFHTFLRDVCGVRRLLPLACVEGLRNTYRILGGGQKTIGMLRFWKCKIRRPSSSRTARRRLYSFEIECLKGYELELGTLPGEIPGLDDAVRHSELDDVLERVGRRPMDYSGRLDIRLDPRTPSRPAACRILDTLFHTVTANEDGVRKDLDSEFLHEFRVAVRRTRSLLTQIKGVFSDEEIGAFKGEFSWLGKVTGPCRDLDVYLLQMDQFEASLPEAVGADLAPLRRFLENQQEKRHRLLVEALDSPRYSSLRAEWKTFLEKARPGSTGAHSRVPISELASRRIWKVLNRILKRGKRIHEDTPAKALHELRIECKKLRYLLEFFRCLYPPDEVSGMIKTLRRLQDNLGDFNDCQVQRAKLKEFARLMVSEGEAVAETLMAMGRLVERLEVREQEVRARFSKRFAGFSSRRNRRTFKRLFRSRLTGEGTV